MVRPRTGVDTGGILVPGHREGLANVVLDVRRPSVTGAAIRFDQDRRDQVRNTHPVDQTFVTVVLCTSARRTLLTRCLASLAALEDDHHEVLIVENTRRPVAPGMATGRARWVHEPRLGLDFARNRALVEARGDIVAFVDDDCEVDAGWLTKIRESFADPSVACVTGRVPPASLASPSQRWFERLTGFDRGPEPIRFSAERGFPVMPNEAGRLGTGCNMAFRKKVFDLIGGFDPALDTRPLISGGGDLDIFARVLEAGGIVEYAPGAIVRHHHRRTLRALVRQLFGYGLAVGALSMKYLIEGRARPRDVLRFQRDFFRWLFGRRGGSRLLGMTLRVVEVLGDLAGPFVYLVVRRRNGRPAPL
jgi:GT2 family glycosyltransferase